jgi:hypothetical protein
MLSGVVRCGWRTVNCGVCDVVLEEQKLRPCVLTSSVCCIICDMTNTTGMSHLKV